MIQIFQIDWFPFRKQQYDDFESEIGLFAMYVTQTRNLLWQERAHNKHIQILN